MGDANTEAGNAKTELSVQRKRDVSFYSFNAAKLEQLRKNKPWMKDPKYFKKVIVSAGASIKMVRPL
jgi:hypothetical protein